MAYRIARILVPLALLTSALPALVAAQAPAPVGGPSAADAPDAVARMAVGFHELPESISPGDIYGGAPVTDTNDVLDFIVVEATDKQSVAATAHQDERVRYVEEDQPYQLLSTPDDPRLSDQYGLEHVRALQAWEAATGRPVKNVCVVDTGVRHTHEDLTGPRWMGGYDFPEDDARPQDTHGHGTHVTGTAAATIDNSVGGAGVANVGFLNAKVIGDGVGTASGITIAEGIQWCADNDGDVISMSLGGHWLATLQDAVRYAWEKGSLLVAAAGNEGCSACVLFPAKFPEVIAVTCTNQAKNLCGFSSSGPEAELTAPGKDILSTYNTNDHSYIHMDGTSMSAPHVSGVAALAWSQVPDLTNEQVRALLQANAQDLGPPGRDNSFGYGMADAAATLSAAQSLVELPCELVSPAAGGVVSGDETLVVETTSQLEEVPLVVDGEHVADMSPTAKDPTRFTATLETRGYADGLHDVEVTCDEGEDGASRTVPYRYVFDNVQTEILSPTDGSRLSGTVTVTVHAASTRGGADEVYASIDGGSPIEIAGNQVEGTDNYTLSWDTTTHHDDSQPATIEAWFLDHGRILTNATPTTVAVDNRPDPAVGIIDPEPGQDIVGPYRIWVEAHSNVDHEGFRVEVRTNGGPWQNITDNHEGEDRYYYDWLSTTEPEENTTIDARVVDHGGRALDSVHVNVTGYGTVWKASQPVRKCIPSEDPTAIDVNCESLPLADG